MIFTENLPVLN